MLNSYMVECYIALGSNLNSPVDRILQAITQLKQLPQFTIKAVSSLYRTPPWGMLSQPDFINAVVKFNTVLSAQEVLAELMALEKKHDRQRIERWGPRTLDCDILVFDNQIIDEPNLIIPHPRMTERSFVLLPLSEIAPDLIIQDKSVKTWLSYCDISQIQKLVGIDYL